MAALRILCFGVASLNALDAFVLTPVGRSYFSTNVTASAEFFKRYLGAKDVPQNITHDPSCASVAAVSFTINRKDVELMFVHDKVKPTGALSASAPVEALIDQWDKVMSKKQLYSQWFDNHDGFGSEGFNVSQAYDDGLEMQKYHPVVRTRVPGTAWTLENFGNPMWTDTQETMMRKWETADPDKCRNNTGTGNPGAGWWKSTYASADPSTAADFAVKVLGFEHANSPYPWPEEVGCTAAQWVKYPGADFMLHFVSSHEYTAGNLSIQDWAKKQEELRNFSLQFFDRHMYNSLIMWADSLDDLVSRLDSLSIQYLPLRFGPNLFAVQLDVPGNGISIQIRGSELMAAKPQQFDACEHYIV